ncbi:hypothetical protein KMP13_13775 [Epibacterium ulvae]|uniref:DUF6455 family protein n=1 Tax=Epibacterium ulvae TaxID=1156985 RepID=UPI001BFC8AA5|nr:DUF6455 family protein [Epibacterium ulvae]MBT8154932.1 hypothetical protein [Epibacterium ulvae]
MSSQKREADRETSRRYPLGQVHRHMWLTKEVAASVGVDLSAAMHSGQLDPRNYSNLVTQCRSSGCDNTCALHVSALPSGRQDEVQDFCPNKALLDRLAKILNDG